MRPVWGQKRGGWQANAAQHSPTESGEPKPSMSGGRQDEPELILTGLRLQLLIGLRVDEDEFFVVEGRIGPESETTGIFSLDLN
jgi:hypothetical protein